MTRSGTARGNEKPRVVSRLQQEIVAGQRDLAGQRDGEIGVAVAVGVALDDRVAVVVFVADLARAPGEVPLADEPRQIVDLLEVDQVLALVEVEDRVGRVRGRLLDLGLDELVAALPAMEQVGVVAAGELVAPLAAVEIVLAVCRP